MAIYSRKKDSKNSKSARNIVPILKIKIDSTQEEELLKGVCYYIENEAKPSKFGLFVVTPNPEILVTASKNPSLATILNTADIAIPDGTGLIVASLGKIARRITGTDFSYSLINVAKSKGWRVCLLGGEQTVSNMAKNNIMTEQTVTSMPGFEILALDGPMLNEKGEPVDEANRRIELKTIVEINKFEPHILLVGFGNPKQEFWVNRNRHELEAGLTMVVGGAFDFWSNKIRRAPRVIRNFGLEWFWRLVQEPSRWRRQLRLVEFLWMVFLEKLGLNR